MQSDDDLQTTLSKWPFILGDVILVATALAIAMLGDWQLSTWQVVSCVISVALGAALFVLPYIIEFQVRLREEAEDRTADVRVLQRHIVSTQEQVEEVATDETESETETPEPESVQGDDEQPVEAVEEGPEEVEEPKAPMVPKSRLDEVLAKNKEMQKKSVGLI